MSGNTFTVTTLLLLASATTVLPAWGAGSQLYMNGAIVAIPCDISTASRNQVVNMGVLPADGVLSNSQELVQPFTIRLMKCTLKHTGNHTLGNQHFRVTFSGYSDGGRFGIEGKARGVVLELKDAQGNLVIPGKELPPQIPILQGKEMQLHYSARVVSNSQPIQVGPYSTLIRYQLDYH